MNPCDERLDVSACCPDWDDYSYQLKQRALTLAWSTMDYLTGGVVSCKTLTIRPTCTDTCDSCNYHAWITTTPWLDAQHCSTCPSSQYALPGMSSGIAEVKVDGVVLDPSLYALIDNRLLVRTDGAAWPTQQDIGLSDTEPNTFSITYESGIPLNEDGKWAVSILACEYAKACSGAKCRLPSSVRSVSRGGVSFEIDDSLFSNGMTGIREVDAFILTVNPHRLKTQPKVWSPDVSKAHFA